jgi:arabinose-5-phosphate isomerase
MTNGSLHGVLTAGDLTRLMEHEMDVLSQPVERIMTRTPRSAESGELASAVAFRMESFGIMAMPVLDAGERLVGVVHLHDLLRARVA